MTDDATGGSHPLVTTAVTAGGIRFPGGGGLSGGTGLSGFDGDDLPDLDVTVDWGSWEPGSVPAARQAEQLRRLLDQAVGADPRWAGRAADRGSILASIEDGRLDALAEALADALLSGASADTFEATLAGVLSDTRWAGLVATTEMARALTAASRESYSANGIQAVEFVSAMDDRVCPACAENEDTGAIPAGMSFPNGDPPVHLSPLSLCSQSCLATARRVRPHRRARCRFPRRRRMSRPMTYNRAMTSRRPPTRFPVRIRGDADTPVTVTTIPCGDGWTWPQARDLIAQGYTPAKAHELSGAPLAALEREARTVALRRGRQVVVVR